MAVSVPNCISFQNTAKKYETSTGKCHRFIPSVPQKFVNCRVKTNIKAESLKKDVVIKKETYKTSYVDDYVEKISDNEKIIAPLDNKCIHYLRTVEEQLRVQLPAPMACSLSEMKDSFRLNYHKPEYEEVKAPEELFKCHVIKLGSEQQPAIPCHRSGFWKRTDPYLTSYKSEYIPHDNIDEKISSKILTFYNVGEFELPAGQGNKPMFDKSTFKNMLPVRLLPKTWERVPHFGMQSEYQNHYKKQTFSYSYPYLQDRCTEFEDPLPPASRWQNLAPPGMYCSEYCTLGGSSVRRIIDQNKSTKDVVRTENCCRIR